MAPGAVIESMTALDKIKGLSVKKKFLLKFFKINPSPTFVFSVDAHFCIQRSFSPQRKSQKESARALGKELSITDRGDLELSSELGLGLGFRD
jgi:hypothetical protein